MHSVKYIVILRRDPSYVIKPGWLGLSESLNYGSLNYGIVLQYALESSQVSVPNAKGPFERKTSVAE